jgi:hypothetical protein
MYRSTFSSAVTVLLPWNSLLTLESEITLLL